MTGGVQVPERYLVPDTSVVVPARIAALIYRRTSLGDVRISLRGVDPEVDAVLMALHIAALKWRGSATGSEAAPAPEPAASSDWLTTTEAAGLAGVTDRALRKAIADRRLTSTRIGGRHRITREDLEHYRAARAA